MGLIQFDRRLTRQPQGVVGLNKAHWLAKDILFVHTGRHAIIDGQPVASPASPVRVAVVGYANTGHPSLSGSAGWVPDGTNNEEYVLPIANVGFSGRTICCWFSGLKDSVSTAAFGVKRPSGDGGIQVYKGSTNLYAGNLRNIVGTSYNSNASTVVARRWAHVALRCLTSANRTSFAFGIAGTTNTSSAVSNPTDANVVRVSGGMTSVAGTSIKGIALPMLIMRALSDDEIARLYQEQLTNPWQLFAPRRIWVPVGAGGGIPTLSLPTYNLVSPTSITPGVTVDWP